MSTANEVLILFSHALSSPSESEQQADILLQVKTAIEAEPSFLPVLYSTILSVASRASPLLKRWIADIVEFVVARLAVLPSPISPEQRIHRGCHSFQFCVVYVHVHVCLCVWVCVCVCCPACVEKKHFKESSWMEEEAARKARQICMQTDRREATHTCTMHYHMHYRHALMLCTPSD
jgi:hypothetical protein